MGAGVVMNDTQQRYAEGYNQGIAGVEFKGHHTAAFITGWNAGNIVRNNIEMKNPSQYGYTQGVADGSMSARDSIDACEEYNSTSDLNAIMDII